MAITELRRSIGQRLRELACSLFGHRWWYFDPQADPADIASGVDAWRTHKHCQRCYRLEMNL